jgi:hypothetical protein
MFERLLLHIYRGRPIDFRDHAAANKNSFVECVVRTIFPLLTELKAKGLTLVFEDKARAWTHIFTRDDVNIDELWKSRG